MILAKLKAATRAQHEGLEQTVDVMNQMFSLDNYKNLLMKFYRFYSTIEPELAKLDWKSIGYNFEERLKTPKLEKDLAFLGLLYEAQKMSVCKYLPDISSIEKAFGSLYVIEGATLGGQIINRHLKQNLDLSPENGGAFFNGYGEKTGEMWKVFCQKITEFSLQNQSSDEAVINAARQTFESFSQNFINPIEDSGRKIVQNSLANL